MVWKFHYSPTGEQCNPRGEQYKKESVKIDGWQLSPGVYWMDERGKEYGLFFENSSLKLAGEPEHEKMRLTV